MGSSNYAAISQEMSHAEESEDPSTRPRRRIWPKEWSSFLSIMTILLAVSIMLNAVLLSRFYLRPWELMSNLPTRYARLARNVHTEIIHYTDHESTNRTIQDAAWQERDLELGPGMLALEKQEARSLDLPRSQRWPWTPSKEVYVLMSTHELHCLHALREYINDNHDQVPKEKQFWSYPHMLHCLNIMRQSIICNADDTPMYTGHVVDGKIAMAGLGQKRMCRDWNALTSWSNAHTACYRPVHRGEADFREIDRYRFCPDGAQPWLKTQDA